MAGFRMLLTVLLVAAFAVSGMAAGLTDSLKPGKAELKSAGSLAFGPEGVLFIGDSIGGMIFAIDTSDAASGTARAVNVTGVNTKIAALLGTSADQITINDMVVNPASRKVYLSVSRGLGPTAQPVILRMDAAGKLEEVAMDNIRHAKVALPNPPAMGEGRAAQMRQEAITDLAWVDGKIFVAGLSNEEFSSNLRSIPFPFEEAGVGAMAEIYHGAHGRFETNSPVRTFVPYTIAQEQHILAAYTCTPLVKFPVNSLQPGQKVMGTTIAELGNRNRPLDMIIYKKNGRDFLLMANNSRGVMKMAADGLDRFDPITNQIADTAGVPYETLSWTGVTQLDSYDDTNAIVLVSQDGGSQDIKTLALP